MVEIVRVVVDGTPAIDRLPLMVVFDDDASGPEVEGAGGAGGAREGFAGEGTASVEEAAFEEATDASVDDCDVGATVGLPTRVALVAAAVTPSAVPLAPCEGGATVGPGLPTRVALVANAAPPGAVTVAPPRAGMTIPRTGGGVAMLEVEGRGPGLARVLVLALAIETLPVRDATVIGVAGVPVVLGDCERTVDRFESGVLVRTFLVAERSPVRDVAPDSLGDAERRSSTETLSSAENCVNRGCELFG